MAPAAPSILVGEAARQCCVMASAWRMRVMGMAISWQYHGRGHGESMAIAWQGHIKGMANGIARAWHEH
eukprot:7506386-Lingulodinium_polyedra.AAC.1